MIYAGEYRVVIPPNLPSVQNFEHKPKRSFYLKHYHRLQKYIASTLQQLIAKNWWVRLLDIHSNFVELKEFFQEKQMENYKHQQLIKKIIEEQEQETKNKKNQEQQGGYSVEERTTVGGGGATATAKAVDIAPRLTSFLEKDESFLTPWSSGSNSSSSSSNQQGRKSYHQFQPGSFFVREYPEYFGSHNYYPGPNQSDSKKPNP